MAVDYHLRQVGGGNGASDDVKFEVVGSALKRLPNPKGTTKLRPCHLNAANRQRGRCKSQGWSRSSRGTARELLERYRDQWQSMITILLPFETTGPQAEAIWNSLKRWVGARRIAALGIAETPNPHFHIAVGCRHDRKAEARLRKWANRVWLRVFGHPPAGSAIQWQPRDETAEAIVKYLSKRSKGGRDVKGTAPWLIFLPYFHARLPKRERQIVRLSAAEARQLCPRYRLTFGASVRLKRSQETRKTKAVHSSSALSTEPRNPVAMTACVAVATHTSTAKVYPNVRQGNQTYCGTCWHRWGRALWPSCFMCGGGFG